MQRCFRFILPICLFVFSLSFSLPALDAQGIAKISGDQTRALFGDGTDVIVAVMDSGIDDTHPGLDGLDRAGAIRLVAEANFAENEPGSTGNDVHGHGTSVSSVIVGADSNLVGLAPDARYINARVIDSNNSFQSTFWVMNGTGFAIENGAEVMNFSLNTFGEFSDGNLSMDRMIDWAAQDQGIISAVCAGNISQSSGGDPSVRAPAGSYNSIAVGWTNASNDYGQLHSGSSIGPTSDGRIKPDIVAPGHLISTYNDDWETQNDFTISSGCSFATPHVSGVLAQQVGYGKARGLSVNPLVLKATMLNSASKNVVDKSGEAWQPFASSTIGEIFTVTSALDDELGAGQVDALSLYRQYSAGEQEAGTIENLGWDLNTITDNNTVEYFFDSELKAGSALAVTLNWFRDVDYSDDGDGVINSGDNYDVVGNLDNLNLSILLNGDVIATSMSLIDNVEHLFLQLTESGFYSIQVDRLDVLGSGNDTLYGLAWTAVPEPGSVMFGLLLLTGMALQRRKY